ncbi:MAG: alpha/beta hydrolase [Candidatus Eiseniibacteriota bacterium]
MALFRDYDQAALDAQYNNRAAVADSPRYMERWPAASRKARERLGGTIDLVYGPHPRHRIDFFPAKGGAKAPVLTFIHGGYWQSQDKSGHSFVAEPFVAAGVAVAMIGYPIAPEVGMDAIVASIRSALVWLGRHAGEHGGDPARLHLTGHSAGGHLTAYMMAEDFSAEPDLPQPLLKGGLALSGLYELEPIRLTYLNQALGMDAAVARRNSPANRPLGRAPLILAVGAAETDEFLRQQRDYAATCRAGGWPVEAIEVPGRNHFSVLEAMADPDAPAGARPPVLSRALLDQISGTNPS